MEDLNNMWNAEDELNEDQLMDYVKGKSSDEAQHIVEKKMNDSSFINDAVEGLQQFSSTEKMNSYVQQINTQLRHRLNEKKRKRKNGITNLSWEIIAVIMIVILCLIGYVIVEMIKK